MKALSVRSPGYCRRLELALQVILVLPLALSKVVYALASLTDADHQRARWHRDGLLCIRIPTGVQDCSKKSADVTGSRSQVRHGRADVSSLAANKVWRSMAAW